MVLLHHRGRSSGREYVTPVMYLPHESEPGIIYVFATKGGAPTHPDWYHNLTAAGNGSVERGTETYSVTIRELTGTEHDRIYAEQAPKQTHILLPLIGRLPGRAGVNRTGAPPGAQGKEEGDTGGRQPNHCALIFALQ